jgi:hypothetical protein
MSIPLDAYLHVPIFSIIAKSTLELAALILGLVNGLMLLRQYFRDRPKLIVSLEDADHLEWSCWFLLPSGTYKELPTRNYGFLIYLDISNAGLRKVQLQSWRLATRNGMLRKCRMPALNMPTVEIELGPVIKQIPVFGQRTDIFHGSTVIDSGCSISGLTFFNLEVYGAGRFDPRVIARAGKPRSIYVQISLTDCFGKKWNRRFSLPERSVEQVTRRIPNINDIPSLMRDLSDWA